ncbi:MAG TPA: flagellar hook-associated protein FlgK [Acidimicrobiales bacterium]|jgi:flagellar hook-associated protein 1 FlgK|nr:flagellar hook-associated protein FlgK [Acidimicrobiales bacterium]
MSNISLSIASSGIDAAQTAMDTIAQNLSNANTPGYVSETPDLVTYNGGGVLHDGAGVGVRGISQAGDSLLTNSANQAAGNLSQSSALQQVLSQAQLAFQEPSATGLSSDLNSFWQSWDTIASNPTSQAGRSQVIDNAQNLVADLQQAHAQLQTTATAAVNQLDSTVQSTNGLLAKVANLNGQITATQATGSSANALIDQRNAAMTQLAESIGAVGAPQSDGSMQVTVGGITLVQGNWSDSISVQNSSGTYSIQAATSQATLTNSAGTTAGLVGALNSYLPSYQSQLDTVANNLENVVNSQLAAGYTATGAAGTALFTGSGAGGIGLNQAIVNDPTQLAAASTSTLPDASNDGSNAQTMANLFDAPNGPDAVYQTLILNVGNQVSNMQNQVTAQTSVSNAANQNLQSIAGVNQNDQLVALMNWQQDYQASAKVISSVNEAVQSLIANV